MIVTCLDALIPMGHCRRIPLNLTTSYLMPVCIILAARSIPPEGAESFHSGPVQDSEYCHTNHYVCAAVVSKESGSAAVQHLSLQLTVSHSENHTDRGPSAKSVRGVFFQFTALNTGKSH